MTEYSKVYSNYKELVDKRMLEFIEKNTNSVDNGNKYLNELNDTLKYILLLGGKRIRPVLLLLCCELFGGKVEEALDASIAIEILHNFTLVHDDIMDNADTRRGNVTIHKKWSVNTAILTGDDLLCLSYRSLLNTNSLRIKEICKEFTDGVIEVCEGQAIDKDFETRDEISINDYLVMIRKKTAELLKSSVVIGANIANAENGEIEYLRSFAENIGLAFQIQDDLLDVYSTELKFGKKIGGDILEKKKTYLYVTALEIAKGDEKDRIQEIFNSNVVDSVRIESIISIYNKLGVLTKAKSEIKYFTNLAVEKLKLLAGKRDINSLIWFSDMLLNRTY
jgi:geranylgeranyl diphosphate synthase, type II